MSRIVRLLVVVQNNLHRRGLEPLLQGMVSHFQIVRLVRSSSEIAAAITQTQFDVLLLDDDLTDDVFSILRQIRHQVPDKPIVLLSDILFPRYIELVLLNGVSGVIYWHDALETALPHVVYTVLQAGHSASPKVTSVMLAHRAQPTAVDLSETD
jgi:DNA-binding NarL/FixJ family response regulator